MTIKNHLARIAKMQAATYKILRLEDEIKIAETQRDNALQERAKAYEEFRALLKAYGLRDDYCCEGALMVLKAAAFDEMRKEAKP